MSYPNLFPVLSNPVSISSDQSQLVIQIRLKPEVEDLLIQPCLRLHRVSKLEVKVPQEASENKSHLDISKTIDRINWSVSQTVSSRLGSGDVLLANAVPGADRKRL